MAKRQVGTQIVGGKFRGTKIPYKLSKDLRPTENKPKEMLFNWLLNDLTGMKCLDMFAGTGSLGLEAISRNADLVVFIDKNKSLCEKISSIVKKIESREYAMIINANCFKVDLRNLTSEFDLIFLDPPYRKGLIDKSLKFLKENPIFSKGGLIYIEIEKDIILPKVINNLIQIKMSSLGESNYYLYEA